MIAALVVLAAAAAAAPVPVVRTSTHAGIRVTMTVDRAKALPGAAGLREGDDVVIRFDVRDEITGTPIRGSRPGGWMDSASRGNRPAACADRVRAYAGASLFDRAQVDLNTFHVAALNDDASITVVDPLFGFGGTKLLAMIPLASPAEDWALSPSEEELFVAMPKARQVASVETRRWTQVRSVTLPEPPTRLVMQPDGVHVWAGVPEGVVVLRAADLSIAASIRTGGGPHDIVFTADHRWALVTNAAAGTVSAIDVRSLKKTAELPAGKRPRSIAWSALARTAWVASEDGRVTIIGGRTPAVMASIDVGPGLTQVRVSPDGRLALLVSPSGRRLYVGDTSRSRIVQTADIDGEPDELAFSPKLAYMRLRNTGDVQMIALGDLGREGARVSVADFPGGQHAFGAGAPQAPSASIVPAPDAGAMLVANPADRAIYYYSEGMAAPIGNFSNYGRQPRAVMVIDRSLRETSPGSYETTRRIDAPGVYDVAFLLDSPRVTDCYEVTFAADPSRHAPAVPPVAVRITGGAVVTPGKKTSLHFRVTRGGKAVDTLDDATVLIFAPGVWQTREKPRGLGDGTFVVEFTPPQAGVYSTYFTAPSLGVSPTWFGTMQSR